jgi:hypothetical protein
MAGLKDDAQWIVLMGFIVSFSLFFLAVIINQSTVIGQTTAESVAEFPKNDIRGVRDVIDQYTLIDGSLTGGANRTVVHSDITTLALSRQNTVLEFGNGTADSYGYFSGWISYINGVTRYKETRSYHV